MKIIITEIQLNKIKEFLIEISVKDAYEKFYKKIPIDIFTKIVKSDPFNKEKFLSPYSKWLLKIYMKNNLRLEDLEAVGDYFLIFDKYKHSDFKGVDFDKFNKLGEFFKVIKPKLDYGKASLGKEINLCEPIDGSEKLYEDENWCVILPKTEYASCYYGRNTEWCTSWGEMSFDERNKDKTNRFEYYNNHGQLFININKNNQKEKYQFHFESKQFMDVDDDSINLIEFFEKPNTKNLKKFYNDFLSHKMKNDSFYDLKMDGSDCYISVKKWSNFESAFEDDKKFRNPALFLEDIYENFIDDNYDYNYNDITMYYFDYINKENIELMKKKLDKKIKINKKNDEEIEEILINNYLDEISSSLNDAKRIANEREAYDSITKAIFDHFKITNVSYENDGIKLKLKECPKPLLVYGMDSSSFIDGYCSLNDGENKIDYSYPYYGFDAKIDNKEFNEILNERLLERS
jgi:hypothetical protein